MRNPISVLSRKQINIFFNPPLPCVLNVTFDWLPFFFWEGKKELLEKKRGLAFPSFCGTYEKPRGKDIAVGKRWQTCTLSFPLFFSEKNSRAKKKGKNLSATSFFCGKKGCVGGHVLGEGSTSSGRYKARLMLLFWRRRGGGRGGGRNCQFVGS